MSEGIGGALRFYTAIIEKAKDGFGVFFPDLPGCTSFGKTVEAAAANAYSAAQAHVALAREYGDEIASPAARMLFRPIMA